VERRPIALVYTRKSRVSKADANDPANSQVRQAEMCATLCQTRGWDVETFSEPEGHRSGASEDKRPGFLALKSRLQREPRPVAVVVWRLDRLSRNKRDIFNFLADLQKRGIDFVTATGAVDTTTAFGRAFLGFQAVVGELERELTAERRMEELAFRQAHGYHVGTVPLGFDRVNGVLRPSDKAETARYILTCYLTGQYGYTPLTRHVNAQDHRTAKGEPFCRESIRAVIENAWVYAGYVERHTDYMAAAKQSLERYEGKHHDSALITEAEARRIEALREQRRTLNFGIRAKAYVYLLSPILYCARCSRRLQGWYAHGRRYYHHPKEGCPGRALVLADPLETALREHLEAHAIPPDMEKEINGYLLELDKDRQRRADTAQAVSALERRRERAKRLYLMGEMDDAELDVELQAVKNELACHLPVGSPPVIPLSVEEIKSIGHILEVASRELQKALVYNLFERLETDGHSLVKAVSRAWALGVFGPALAIG